MNEEKQSGLTPPGRFGTARTSAAAFLEVEPLPKTASA